jgi:hypothetical protein
MLDSPMNEDALEGLGLGQPNRSVLLRVLQGQEVTAQHGRMREIGMVISERAEFDHGATLPQAVSCFHTSEVDGTPAQIIRRTAFSAGMPHCFPPSAAA